ncbi:MAG: hypothetical protein ACE5PM_06280 [Candidatus Hydrothermarchaeales archaeon]
MDSIKCQHCGKPLEVRGKVLLNEARIRNIVDNLEVIVYSLKRFALNEE